MAAAGCPVILSRWLSFLAHLCSRCCPCECVGAVATNVFCWQLPRYLQTAALHVFGRRRWLSWTAPPLSPATTTRSPPALSSTGWPGAGGGSVRCREAAR
jgi:hypothetical protein